jgi:hypothetical protein
MRLAPFIAVLLVLCIARSLGRGAPPLPAALKGKFEFAGEYRTNYPDGSQEIRTESLATTPIRLSLCQTDGYFYALGAYYNYYRPEDGTLVYGTSGSEDTNWMSTLDDVLYSSDGVAYQGNSRPTAPLHSHGYVMMGSARYSQHVYRSMVFWGRNVPWEDYSLTGTGTMWMRLLWATNGSCMLDSLLVCDRTSTNYDTWWYTDNTWDVYVTDVFADYTWHHFSLPSQEAPGSPTTFGYAGMELLTPVTVSTNERSYYFDLSTTMKFWDMYHPPDMTFQGNLIPEPGGFGVTLHRVEGEAAGVTPNDDSEAPIPVAPLPWKLDSQPLLGKGVVADGVTPVLIKIKSKVELKVPTKYRISLATLSPCGDCESVLKGKLRVMLPGNQSFSAPGVSTEVTLLPENPVSYAYIEGIKCEELAGNTSGEVKVLVTVTDPVGNMDTEEFFIRKPPIVLVHGYNADSNTWGQDFLSALYLKRPEDFIRPINYLPG